MKTESITNQHPEVLMTCDNPECGRQYVFQKGGQKAMAPVVLVKMMMIMKFDNFSGKHDNVLSEVVLRLCSPACLAVMQGEKLENTMAYKVHRSWGVNLDKVFPPDKDGLPYLAPARRPKLSKDF